MNTKQYTNNYRYIRMRLYWFLKMNKITLDKYAQILKVGFKNSSLTKIPGTQDQVMMGDIDRSRSHKVKAIFIIGLNDGVFPSDKKR